MKLGDLFTIQEGKCSMSLPADFQNEVRREWVFRVYYNSNCPENYELRFRNRVGVRRCISCPKHLEPIFMGKPSQYILKYLQDRYKFKNLTITLIERIDL